MNFDPIHCECASQAAEMAQHGDDEVTVKHGRFRAGDLVEVVTVNRANGDGATDRAMMARKERWKAVVVGPSVMGAGWWIVKKVNGRSSNWRTYTIPATEMIRVRR